MEKSQAIDRMLEGEKITHVLFTPNEYMTISQDDTELIVFEDGYTIHLADFYHDRQGKEWDDGYSIFKTT